MTQSADHEDPPMDQPPDLTGLPAIAPPEALLLAGVRPGDEVIAPTLTFISTVNAVSYAGAYPVFMDCDEYLDLDAGKLAAVLSKECGRGAAGLVHRCTG